MQLKRRGTINPLKARKHYRWVKMMFWNTTAQWKQGAPAAVTWLVSESFISQWNPVSTHRGTELVCSSGEVVWNITLLMEISLLPFEQGAQAFSIIWISLSSEFSYHHQPISLHHLSWHFVPEISSLIWCLPNKVPVQIHTMITFSYLIILTVSSASRVGSHVFQTKTCVQFSTFRLDEEDRRPKSAHFHTWAIFILHAGFYRDQKLFRIHT